MLNSCQMGDFYINLKSISKYCQKLETIVLQILYRPHQTNEANEKATILNDESRFDSEAIPGKNSHIYPKSFSKLLLSLDDNDLPNLKAFDISFKTCHNRGVEWFLTDIQKWRAFQNGKSSVAKLDDETRLLHLVSDPPPETLTYPQILTLPNRKWMVEKIFGSSPTNKNKIH